MGSVCVAGTPAPMASRVMHGGRARSIHLNSVSEKLPRHHEHPRPVATTTADKLRRAFAAFYHIAPRDVGAVAAGTLHMASEPAQQQFWATAEFRPSRRATPRVAIDFQDGGDIGIFRSGNDMSWHMSGAGGEPFPCPARVPSGVLAAWSLAPSPLCANHARHHRASRRPIRLAGPSTTAGTIAQVAESQVGVGDTPVSRTFSGSDCNPYTALVRQRPGSAGCGVSPRFNVRDQSEFWCADFAKWVWRRAGVKADLGTLNPGAASFYTWALEQGQRPRFGSDAPAVGDAVVFYPPWASTAAGNWADHVGIVVAVNSNGTVDLVNGDFGGDGIPITVEQDNNISIASWASAVWNSGEKWIFVSPGAASAPPPRSPAISSFTASPSFLPGAGGLVTLTVSASNAASYLFTSTPSGPTGLAPVQSDSGEARHTVTIPLNATGQPVSYTFTVTAAACGAHQQRRFGDGTEFGFGGVTLPSPAPGVAAASPSALLFFAAVTGTAGHQDRIPGLARPERFGRGQGYTVPLNATGQPVSYTFTVTAAGPAGRTSSAVLVTVPSLVSGGYSNPAVRSTQADRCLQRHPRRRAHHDAGDRPWCLDDRCADLGPVRAAGCGGRHLAPVRGAQPDRRVRHRAPTARSTCCGPTAEGTWHSAPVTAPRFAPPGAAIATSPQYGVPNRTDAFVTGTNGGAVDLLWANSKGTWHSAPVTAPGSPPPGAAIATSPQYGVPNRTDAFVTGTNTARSTCCGPTARAPGTAHRSPPPRFCPARRTQPSPPHRNTGCPTAPTRSSPAPTARSTCCGPTARAPGTAHRSPPPGSPRQAQPSPPHPQYGAPNRTDAFLVGTNGALNLLWANSEGTWHSAPVSDPGLAPPGAAIATSAQYSAW